MRREAGLGVAALLGKLGAVGALRLRKRESARGERARQLARSAIREETEVRRQVAEVIHDGPVQELIALDMVLASARQALDKGEAERGSRLVAEARELTARNVRLLRDELVDLVPHGLEDADYGAALERCRPIWERRYGFEVRLAIESVPLRAEQAGELFRITQEAVANAGRHSGAQRVSVGLRCSDGRAELRVVDDGEGTGGDPPGDPEAGHLGLATIRARAELMGGELEIESSERGTELSVRVPLEANGRAAGRQMPGASS